MENMDSSDESDHDLISTDILEDIRDGSQTIQTLIKGNHVLKYVNVLYKGNRNPG